MSDNKVILRAIDKEIEVLERAKETKKTISDLKNALQIRIDYFFEKSVLLYKNDNCSKINIESDYSALYLELDSFLREFKDILWDNVCLHDENVVFKLEVDKELLVLQKMRENLIGRNKEG